MQCNLQFIFLEVCALQFGMRIGVRSSFESRAFEGISATACSLLKNFCKFDPTFDGTRRLTKN
jgi:hypothetical protein